MPSMRRNYALGLALAVVLLYFLFFSGSSTTDFPKTNSELQRILDQRKHNLVSEQAPIEEVDRAAPHMGRPMPKRPEEMEADTALEDTDKKPAKAHDKPLYPAQGGASNEVHDKGDAAGQTSHKTEHNKDAGEEMAREELQTLLKKSPIVIFSKSYCPYSKAAKALLLETYTITPTPHVVELDQMTQKVPKPPRQHIGDDGDDDESPSPTLGRKLQDLLATLTGRRTVPNIMINAQSLGGSDDLGHMHAIGTLEEEIKKLGGKRIVHQTKA